MAEAPPLAAIVAARADLRIDRDAFAAHVRAIAAHTGEVPGALALDDLCLAFAAAHGDAAAIVELERDVLPVAEPALRVFGADRDMIAECLQRVRERVLVGPDRPRLLDYRGQGRLRAWLRVVAVREALMMHRDRKREVELGDALLASVPDPADDPELVYLRGEVRDDLPAALEAAIQSLSPRERTVLRYSLLDGLSLDEIGAIYAVNKSTVSRWLAAVREKLWQTARAVLVERLGDSQDVTSLVRGLQGSLALSLERLLGEPEG